LLNLLSVSRFTNRQPQANSETNNPINNNENPAVTNTEPSNPQTGNLQFDNTTNITLNPRSDNLLGNKRYSENDIELENNKKEEINNNPNEQNNQFINNFSNRIGNDIGEDNRDRINSESSFDIIVEEFYENENENENAQADEDDDDEDL